MKFVELRFIQSYFVKAQSTLIVFNVGELNLYSKSISTTRNRNQKHHRI